VPTINLYIPNDLNERRKTLPGEPTWKDIIQAGITSLDSTKGKKITFNPSVEEEMKQAALHMSNAWNIIKKSKDPV
jgi:hypothetical protein